MQVEFGNNSPRDSEGTKIEIDAPIVTYVNIPDTYSFDPSIQVSDLALHLARNPDVTHLPANEALVAVTHPMSGIWGRHGEGGPSWIWSDNKDLQAVLSGFYGVSGGRPDDIEITHYTRFGAPGVGPIVVTPPDVQANITQNGRDMWAWLNGGYQVGAMGQASASTSTTLTTTTTATLNSFAGSRVFATVSATSVVWGNIVSNTTGANTVLTVDRWYTPATPGGAAGSQPAATATYVIADGASPAWFMGLSASTTALGTPSTNTSLPGEIVTSGGGLIRKICPWAHSATTNTYTLTPVFTVNGSDTVPVTIGSVGVFNSMVVADTGSEPMLFNTLLGTTATLSLSGDQLTLVQTVTGT